MVEWQVVLISGPAGAGKTTAARAFAVGQAVPAVHLSLDAFRGAVVSGFANPVLGWNEECGRQYRLARGACADAVRRYAEAGFKVVVDDAIFPDWPEADLAGWQDALEGLAWQIVILMPTLDECIARDQRRPDHIVGRQMVETIYGMMQAWRRRGVPVLDNSALSPEATARLINKSLS